MRDTKLAVVLEWAERIVEVASIALPAIRTIGNVLFPDKSVDEE